MTREPIAIIELIKIVAQSGVLWAVGMGWWVIDSTQQGLTLAFVMALINLIGAVVQRQLVTPMADPRNNAGEELMTQAQADK